MKKLLATTLLTSALFAGIAVAADDYVMLQIGTQEVKKSEVEALWSGLFPKGQAPVFDSVDDQVKQNVLRGIVSERLLYDESVKSGLDKDKTVLASIEDMKRKVIVKSFLEKKTDGLVTDKEVQDAYDTFVKENRDKEEVRARHILVDTEAKAKDLKAKIDKGESFDDLAKNNSSDTGTAKQGGDLGYFTQDKMVAEFSKAAFALKPGEVSGPVKSSFGYHIIKVEDRRKAQMPTFNDVKEQIKSGLQQQKLNDFVVKLVDKTGVKYFGADGKEKEFTKSPDPKAKEKK